MSDEDPANYAARAGCAGLTGVLVAFLVGNIVFFHLCDSHSAWLEWPLLFGTAAVATRWTFRAPSGGWQVFRSLAALILAVVLALAYLEWVHSAAFPQVLRTGQQPRPPRSELPRRHESFRRVPAPQPSH